MKTLTEHLLPHAEAMDEYFVRGSHRASRHELGLAQKLWASYRAKRGFVERVTPLLTPPDANAKLIKGVTPSYGLTLQHTTTRVRKGLIVNACPHAGDCQRVCVLDNGNGSFVAVQEARRAKVDFLCSQPRAFAYLLGWELAAAQHKHGRILFRPNVNSDVRWDLVLPAMFHPDVTGGMTSYGYTKDPFVLDTDGWVTNTYRLAYSWNETSDPAAVWSFLERGGSVAMVTDRRKGHFQQRQVHMPGADHLFINHYRHLDADLTDEWMFEPGVIGDLSAKGRARRLISKSGFVVTTGEAA
jgi:hypothetical protein